MSSGTAMRSTSKRQLNDEIALEAEHDHDGEEQRGERERADGGDEARLIPGAAFDAQKNESA